MAYSPPLGNAVDFDYLAPDYAPPSGDNVVFDFAALGIPSIGVIQFIGLTPTFGGSPPFTGSPGQLTITLTGKHPALVWETTPGQGIIDIIGATPAFAGSFPFIDTPSQLAIALTGLQPTSLAGTMPQRGVIQVIGQTPSFDGSFPFVASPSQLAITLTGLQPTSLIETTATAGVIHFTGLTPAFDGSFPFVDAPVQLDIAFTGGQPVALYDVNPTVAALQLGHAFNAALITPDDIRYSLILDNGIIQYTVPMLSFIYRHDFDGFTGAPVDTLAVTAPAAFYDGSAAFVGASVKLYKSAKGVSRLLATLTLASASSDGEIATLKGEAAGAYSTAHLELSGAQAVRVINSGLTVRLPPNFDVKRGARVTVGGMSVEVAKSVIYVARNQQFMELS